MILVPTALSFGTMHVPRVFTQRPDEELISHQLSHTSKFNGKKIIFTSLACKVGLEDLSKSGAVRILNCNMNFLKLKRTLLPSTSSTEHPIGQSTRKEGTAITLKMPCIYLYVKLVFDHLSFLGKKLYSPTSGTPHLGFRISSYVSSSNLPVTSKPKKACISRSLDATVLALFLIMPAGFGRRS